MEKALRHHGDEFYTKKKPHNSIQKSTGMFKGKDNAVQILYKLCFPELGEK